MKALETSTKDDDTKWLTYWVLYAVFSVVEFFTGYLYAIIPFYFLLKVSFWYKLTFVITAKTKTEISSLFRSVFSSFGVCCQSQTTDRWLFTKESFDHISWSINPLPMMPSIKLPTKPRSSSPTFSRRLNKLLVLWGLFQHPIYFPSN